MSICFFHLGYVQLHESSTTLLKLFTGFSKLSKNGMSLIIWTISSLYFLRTLTSPHILNNLMIFSQHLDYPKLQKKIHMVAQ